jgi:hypothetical protein
MTRCEFNPERCEPSPLVIREAPAPPTAAALTGRDSLQSEYATASYFWRSNQKTRTASHNLESRLVDHERESISQAAATLRAWTLRGDAHR